MKKLLCMVVELCCAMPVPLAFADEWQGLSPQLREKRPAVMAAAGRNTPLFFGRPMVAHGY